jgi:hypothetical protein
MTIVDFGFWIGKKRYFGISKISNRESSIMAGSGVRGQRS